MRAVTTIAPRRRAREVAGYPRHHTSSVARETGKRLGCSEVAAQRRIERAREVLTVLPDAAIAAGRPDWLRLWSAQFDIARRAGSGIPYSLSALRTAAAADNMEDQTLVDLLTDDSPENLDRHIKALEHEITVKSECLVALKEERARRQLTKGPTQ